ncbi:MAG: stage IV sporulation protein A [Clostridia bacterium]|jgi:stage IV sporulation protein A|nr:stage IV sporulation protein A [Clostridia bacterium]
MEEFDIYKDISERTGGDIYIGVVGPVRAGKSTFITNFMEKLVVPNVEDEHEKARMTDELPQSAAGKTVMTTQPKFVPSEAVRLNLADNVEVNVRLVDCVGYMIDGAVGHLDGEKPRMVRTPWSDEEIPFTQAAEIGTRKVIADHSTVGVVMTSDGSIATELPRSAYVAAEERAVGELKGLGKPFVVVLNSTVPGSNETMKLAESLSEKYGACVVPMDVLNLSEEDIRKLFENLLMEFPLRMIDVRLTKWLRALPADNKIIASLNDKLAEVSAKMSKMSDYAMALTLVEDSEFFEEAFVEKVELGTGKIICTVRPKEGLFYEALSEECGVEINDEFALISSLKQLVHAKREYDKLSAALEEVRETGYGVVTPALEEMTLEEPEIVKQGSRFGVKLKASAPSLHIMQVDIEAEVSPIVGTEQQSEELVKSLLSEFESDPKGIWETNMFGKSLHMLVNEGLNNKLSSMPTDTQRKMRRTLSRIINEGKGGVICILL